MQLGMVGLGRMGSGMTKRLERDGHEVKTFDPKVTSTAKTLRALAKQLDAPRHVWMMVPSGEITEDTFQKLLGILEPGDTIVDGGNSNFRDSQRRYKEARKRKISFADVGVSGGIWGLEAGFCLMAGGDKAPLKRLAPIFGSLAPENGWAHVGPSGAGHFTKMVHNGIEYGLMQAYAEGFELMYHSEFELDLSEVAGIWRYGSVVRSWLLELLYAAMEQHGDHLDDIAPYVEDSGEGRWTINEAIHANVPVPAITAALFARFASRREIDFSAKVQAALRNQFGGHAVKAAKAAKASDLEQRGREPAPRGLAAASQPGPVRDRDLRRLRRPDAAQDLPCALLARGASATAGALRDRRRRAYGADDKTVGRRHEEGGQGARPRRAAGQRLERACRRDALRRDRLRRRSRRGRRRRRTPRARREARVREGTASTTSPFRPPRSRRS